MKMLRKISVVALVLVLVCLFSTSAFAAEYSDLEQFSEESILSAYAELTRTSNTASLSIVYAPGLTNSHLEVDCIYDYLPPSGTARSGSESKVSSGEYCSFNLNTTNNTNIYCFIDARYSFYADYTAYAGTFLYNPESVDLVA